MHRLTCTAGPHKQVYFIWIFFIKHNNRSTLWYDVHLSAKHYILLVFQGIDNRTSRWHSVFRYTHYIQANVWCLRNIFSLSSWMTTYSKLHENDQRVLFNIQMWLPLFIAWFLPEIQTGYLNVFHLQKKMKEANLDYWNALHILQCKHMPSTCNCLKSPLGIS